MQKGRFFFLSKGMDSSDALVLEFIHIYVSFKQRRHKQYIKNIIINEIEIKRSRQVKTSNETHE